MSVVAVDVGTATGYLDLDISGFLSGLQTANAQASTQMGGIATTVSNKMTGIGKSMTSAGTTLSKKVTVPITAMGTAIVTTSANFEAGMSKVSAISGATGKDLDSLKKKAKEMGAKTKFSATEAASAFEYMAMAGWGTEAMLDGIEPVMNLAAASGEDLATTSDIVTDALTAFGLSAKDAGHFTDVLAKASSSSNTNVSLLGESFKYVAPVCGALGMSADDAAVALGLMANSGIKGSQAGTALRSALTRLVSPTDDAAVMMDKYGISMTNSDGSMKSLSQVMEMLRGKLGNLTEAEQAQVASTLFGKEAMSGMLAIINASEEDYQNLTDSIANCDGAASSMAATMNDNLKGQLTLLKSALEGVALQLGEILLPHIKNFVAKIQELVQKFSELSPEQQEQIVKFAAIAAAIGPCLVIVGKLITTIGTTISVVQKLKSGLTLLGTAIGGISAPVVAIVAVIGVLIAAFVNLWRNNEEFRNNVIAIWDGIKAKFETFAQGIVDRLNALGFDFENITQVLKAIWDGFCAILAPVFEGVFNNISIFIGTILDVITGILDVFIGLFTGNWDQCWNGIKGIFEAVWNGMKDWFMNILNVIKGVFDVVLGWFGTSWDACWNGIKSFFEGIWNGIVSFFTGILTGIQTTVTTVWTAISTFFSTTFTAIQNVFMTIWNAISGFLSTTWETIKNIVQVGIMFIKELFSAAFQILTVPFRFIWENCKETIMTIWNAIKTTISTVLSAIQTTISTVWNAVKTVFTTVWNAISSFVSTIWNNIKTNITTVINAIKTVISTVMNAIKTTISTIWNAIKTTISTVINAIKSVVTSVFNAVKTTVTNVFNNIKSTATSVWNGIKTAITTPINAAKSTVTSVVNSIKSTISSGFNAAKSTVTNVFNSIKNSITNVMNGAKNAVSNAINAIKSKFNFSWSLPKLKMPHLKISGKFSLDPPSVPSFSIDWYKKAMNNAMILNGATIFGAQGGKLLGGGEAGSEVVSGADTLMNMIQSAVRNVMVSFMLRLSAYLESIASAYISSNDKLLLYVGQLLDASMKFVEAVDNLGYVAYNGFSEQRRKVEETANNNGGNKDGGGDTFIFNSPKAIDEVEAARQLRNTKKELAEGF